MLYVLGIPLIKKENNNKIIICIYSQKLFLHQHFQIKRRSPWSTTKATDKLVDHKGSIDLKRTRLEKPFVGNERWDCKEMSNKDWGGKIIGAKPGEGVPCYRGLSRRGKYEPRRERPLPAGK